MKPRALESILSTEAALQSRRRFLWTGGAMIVTASCDRLVQPPSGPTPDALPPITPNAMFYLTSCCGTPSVDAASWAIDVLDRGAAKGSIDLAFLRGLDARDKEHTLQCIGSGPGNQAIGNAVWTGLPLLEIFAAKGIVRPTSGVVELKMTGADGYATAIPVDDLDRPAWLVWEMNGDPLPPEHGFPARLLVPGRYGMKNPKWITRMEFVAQPFLGFWETRGWSDDATYRPNSFVKDPSDEQSTPAGVVRVLGTAFAGSDPVVKVEVSSDSMQTWEEADLTYAPGPDIWALWAYDWDVTSPGDHTLFTRVTTASGATSNGDPDGTDPLGGYNGSMALHLTVL